jgi:hypothetical protein
MTKGLYPKLKIIQKNHRNRNRAQLTKYLLEHPCIDCGETDLRVLDFDHRDPSIKSYNIGRLTNGSHCSWKKILTEISKCDVRCSNCHRKKTIGNPEWFIDPIGFINKIDFLTQNTKLIKSTIMHGARNSYTHRKCRCDVCKAENTRYNRENRKKHASVPALTSN